MGEATSLYRRWYDRDPLLSGMVRQLYELPPLTRILVAQRINTYTETNSEAKKVLVYEKNLGQAKVMGLYKAQHGKRWYDKDPELRKLFTLLYKLETAQRRFLAIRILELVALVIDYQTLADSLAAAGVRERGSSLERVTQCYVRDGLEQARAELALLQEHLPPPGGSP